VKGAGRGLKIGVEDTNLGIKTNPMSEWSQVTPDIYKSKVMRGLSKALGYELGVPDRAFFQSAFDESVANQMKAQKLKKVTPDIMETANAEALYRTFQNNSAIANALSKGKKFLNANREFGLGSLLLKYPKTPGNILSVGLDYSPVGFVKGLKQFYDAKSVLTPAAQRQAIMNISRGMTGSGLILGGAFLAKNGIITGRKASDKDQAAANRDTGQGPFVFNMTALGRLLKGEDTARAPAT
jgi:hypothetical protein